MPVTVRLADPSVVPLPRVVGGTEAAPEEWQAWSEEPGAELVAVDDGRVVGGIHVSMVGRAEAWMENLRVDPQARGRGIGSRLIQEAEAVARRYGAAAMRAGVPSHAHAARAVVERAGYRPLARCAVVSAPASGLPPDLTAEVLPPAGAADVMRLAGSSRVLAAWAGLIPLGWRFRRLVPELVRGLARDGRVVVARRPEGAEAAVAVYARRGDVAVLSWVEGPPDGQQAAVGRVVERARPARLVAFTPDPALLAFAARWSPHPWCPDGLVVVHRSLAS